MQFVLLIYEKETDYEASTSAELRQQMIAKHMAFRGALGERRLASGGLRPTPTAKTVRVDGARRSVHDGPFGETKEQLAGFYFIDVANFDEALALANQVPLRETGAVEVRALLGQS